MSDVKPEDKKVESVTSVSDVKPEDEKVESVTSVSNNQSEVGQTFDVKTTSAHTFIDTVVAGNTSKPTKRVLFPKTK